MHRVERATVESAGNTIRWDGDSIIRLGFDGALLSRKRVRVTSAACGDASIINLTGKLSNCSGRQRFEQRQCRTIHAGSAGSSSV
jgi:hypothetical protein